MNKAKNSQLKQYHYSGILTYTRECNSIPNIYLYHISRHVSVDTVRIYLVLVFVQLRIHTYGTDFHVRVDCMAPTASPPPPKIKLLPLGSAGSSHYDDNNKGLSCLEMLQCHVQFSTFCHPPREGHELRGIPIFPVMSLSILCPYTLSLHMPIG